MENGPNTRQAALTTALGELADSPPGRRERIAQLLKQLLKLDEAGGTKIEVRRKAKELIKKSAKQEMQSPDEN